MHMRILMFGWLENRAHAGGMEVHISHLSEKLAKLGHSVMLFAPDISCNAQSVRGLEVRKISFNPPAHSAADSAAGSDADSAEPEARALEKILEFNKRMALDASKLAKEKRAFDIIHSHDWLTAPAAMEIRKELGKYSAKRTPWIHTIHSLEHIRATEKTASPIMELERGAADECDGIITVSSLMKSEILKKYPACKGKIYTAHNYSSLNASALAGAWADAGQKQKRTHARILFAGRLALQKGIETLILAFGRARKKIPNATLHIVGEGSLKQSLKKFSEACSCSDAVEFKGFVREKDLVCEYLAASVFVSPSVFEPFGITLVDAALLGVPIIATKSTGARDIFSKNSIILCRPQDSEALSECIVSVLENRRLGESLSKNALSDAMACGGWDAVAEKTIAIYGRIKNYSL